MSRERKHYTIEDGLIGYIEDIKNKYSCRSRSEALEIIIREHKNNSVISAEQQVNIIAEKVAEVVKGQMKLIRLIGNNTDKNVQVLIEMMNGLFINENYMDIMTTDERMHEAFQTAQKTVRERIEKQAIRKYDRTYD